MADDVAAIVAPDLGPEFSETNLRQEFLSYQYRFAPFSDHYSIVARFAREKALLAVRRVLNEEAE